MSKRFIYLALAGATLALAACDSGGGNEEDDLTAAVNSFGRVFAAGFFAGPETDVLVNPMPGDLMVDPTADPIDF